MDDLISRADAIRIAEQGQVQGYEWQFKKLVALPSIEPSIIRCKDCKHAHLTYDDDVKQCDMVRDDDDILITVYYSGDHYCGFAERRTDG